MFVVAFNGPPRCGKDTLAGMLRGLIEKEIGHVPVREVSLSEPLRHMAYAMVGMTYSDSTYEGFKETRFPLLNASGRQLMIDCSEEFLKNVYGDSIMARMLLTKLQGFEGIVLIRDCGFQLELDPIIQHVTAANLCLVNVLRPGTSFKGDSREWVNHDGKYQMQIHNDKDLTHLMAEAERLLTFLLIQTGWAL